MHAVIVVTGSPQQEAYWQARLAETAIAPAPLVLTVCETWQGGAGNGLGTLNAYLQACEKAQQLYQVNLQERQQQGWSLAMYHTAGEGKRLFPLSAAEHNNKAAVHLPYGIHGMTLLEAVIRQTTPYASGRPGRLSVFWGDQIFIPSAPTPTSQNSHVDILARMGPLPNRKQFETQNLKNYGLLVQSKGGAIHLLEKVDYDALRQIASSDSSVGTSLGSFSVSWPFLKRLLELFSEELRTKTGKLDTDPHFWMPLTLNKETYKTLVGQKGVSTELAEQYFARMQPLREGFQQLFRIVDIGMTSHWWDYGSVGSYYRNSHRLTETGDEADAMRTFFNMTNRQSANHLSNVQIDDSSIVCGCRIRSGTIRNSVLIGVTADLIDVTDSVLINTTSREIRGTKALSYAVVAPDQLQLPERGVRADVFVAEGQQQFKMLTSLDRDGKLDWDIRLNGNPLSYAQLYRINQQADLAQADRLAMSMHQSLARELVVSSQ